MRQSIRFLCMLLLALSLSAGAAGSTSAQTPNPWGIDPTDPSPIRAQGEAGGGTVTKTFELTLTGDVPEGEVAFVIYETSDGGGDIIFFCGPPEFSQVPCEAGTYTSDPITLDTGTEVSYVYLAGDPQAEGPRFEEEGMETLTESMVNRAAFAYGGDKQDDTQVGNEQEGETDTDEGTDVAEPVDEQKGDTLPVTGGAVPASVPWGSVAVLGLLLTSGYAALRRR